MTRSKEAEGALTLLELPFLLLDVVPHAAAPERMFSTMGWQQSKLWNRLSGTSTTTLTAIKVFHDAEEQRSVSSCS
jgi:hypothetical protein